MNYPESALILFATAYHLANPGVLIYVRQICLNDFQAWQLYLDHSTNLDPSYEPAAEVTFLQLTTTPCLEAEIVLQGVASTVFPETKDIEAWRSYLLYFSASPSPFTSAGESDLNLGPWGL